MDTIVETPRYVAATKLYAILRSQLGCVDMGWRDETTWYWVTPNGVAFCVAHPASEANCCIGPGSRGDLCFPYAYVRELLGQVSRLIAARAPGPFSHSPDEFALA